MNDNLKERLTDMSVLASSRTPADALQYIEELEAEIADLKAKLEKVVVVLQGMESDMKGLDYYNAYFICKDLIAELTSSEAANNEAKGGNDE